MASTHTSPHRSSIRTRLNLLIIGAVAFSTLPAAGLVAGDAIERQAQTRWTMATGAAELLAGNATEAAQSHNATTAAAVMRAATQIPGIAYARLDLPDGQMLAEAGAGSRLPTDIVLEAGGKRGPVAGLAFHRVVRVIAPVRQGENTLGEVTIVETSGAFAPDLLRALAGILLFSTCALAGSLYLARRMQNAMTCPVGELTQSMDAVRRYGDLSQRVVTHSRDEIGALVDSYNLMLEALARRGTGIPPPAVADTVEAPAEALVDTLSDAPLDDFPTVAAEIGPIETAAPDIVPEPETAPGIAPEIVPEIAPATAPEVAADIIPEVEPDIAGHTELDVLDWADALVARFGAAARDKGLELVTFADPAAPRHVPVDEARLDSVVSALIDNALKFTQTGHVTLEIAADPKPDFWRLIVHDTGVGIARPRLKSILRPTEADGTTHPAAPLRLPAARRIVEAMGGAMAVTSEADGSQFHVRLPALPDASRAAPPRADGCTMAIRLSAPAERDVLARRFEAAGVAITGDTGRADLVLADLAARDDLSVPADRLVLLTDIEGDEQAWVAQGRAWAGLRRPLRYNDIDALIEVMARDEASRTEPLPPADDFDADEPPQAFEAIVAESETVEPEPPLQLYPKQAPEALATIVAAFQTRNAAAMADAARHLTALSLEIGARSVAEAAAGIEHAVRIEDRAVAIDEVARLHARLERTLASLADAGAAEPAQALAG